MKIGRRNYFKSVNKHSHSLRGFNIIPKSLTMGTGAKKERKLKNIPWKQDCPQFLWHNHVQKGSSSSKGCTNSSSSVNASPSGLCWRLQLCDASLLDAVLESDDLWWGGGELWKCDTEEDIISRQHFTRHPKNRAYKCIEKDHWLRTLHWRHFFKITAVRSKPVFIAPLSVRLQLPACRASGYKDVTVYLMLCVMTQYFTVKPFRCRNKRLEPHL